MHPDLRIIRNALYSGQISAAKVDTQRAFDRLFHTDEMSPAPDASTTVRDMKTQPVCPACGFAPTLVAASAPELIAVANGLLERARRLGRGEEEPATTG